MDVDVIRDPNINDDSKSNLSSKISISESPSVNISKKVEDNKTKSTAHTGSKLNKKSTNLPSKETNSINNQKKKKRRRRKKGTAGNLQNDEVKYSPSTSPSSGSPRVCRKSTQNVNVGGSTPVLRPAGAQVPRAPENSTQFIIDDHEDSVMYFGFEEFNNTYNTDNIIAEFESDYKFAREEALLSLSLDDLKSHVTRLEAKASVLTDALSASPSRLLERLQSQLLYLQEENKTLRAAALKKQEHSSSSSSSSDSDSDSDSTSDSSSACSWSDCEECADKNRDLDEEKENTSPKDFDRLPEAI